jgi:hypothetical protein
MEDFSHLNYKIKPNFKLVLGEGEDLEGYFFSKGNYYFFSENQLSDECRIELVSKTKQGFKSHCSNLNIDIPPIFWNQIRRMQ